MLMFMVVCTCQVSFPTAAQHNKLTLYTLVEADRTGSVLELNQELTS